MSSALGRVETLLIPLARPSSGVETRHGQAPEGFQTTRGEVGKPTDSVVHLCGDPVAPLQS